MSVQLSLKRPHAEDQSSCKRVPGPGNDCPICFDPLKEPFVTTCGHSFCYLCVKECLEKTGSCPTCDTFIGPADNLIPNRALDNAVRQDVKLADAMLKDMSHTKPNEIMKLVEKMDYKDMARIAEEITAKLNSCNPKLDWREKVVPSFFEKVEQDLTREMEDTQTKLRIVRDDLKAVKISSEKQIHSIGNNIVPSTLLKRQHEVQLPTSQQKLQKEFSLSKVDPPPALRLRLHTHHEDLKEIYYQLCCESLQDELGRGSRLKRFSEALENFTRFSSFRTLASFSYGGRHTAKNFVSSIEFDCDQDHFATADVNCRIKIYNYHAIMSNPLFDQLCPVAELYHSDKISSLSWNPCHKSMLASCDYEGKVFVWDTSAMRRMQQFQEHQQLTWSVDFNSVMPNVLASASDDTTVRLWQIGTEYSVGLVRAPANVCCVKFHPKQKNNFAIACADHCVHYYDLRNLKEPLFKLEGHRKAVSYCKFLNDSEIVSASTDGQLKLWNIDRQDCLQSFHGHVNEQRFVGMATNEQYILCGSEDNSLYVYMKNVTKPLLRHKFDGPQNLFTRPSSRKDEKGEFVSAVCWRQGHNTIIAANSIGSVKIFELI